LLHGFCGSLRYWDEIMPALSEKYRVIAPDLRGHGSSSAPEGDYKMEQLADDLATLLGVLQVPQVYLLGHSLGGYAALAFAQKYPDKLLGWGLLHSTPLPDTHVAKNNRLKAVEQIKTEGIKPFVDGLIPKLFAEDNRKTMLDKIAAAKEIGYETSVQGAIGCSLGMKDRSDRSGVLERSLVPVLLLAGEKDEVITKDRRFPLTKQKHITEVTIPNIGHMGMMEAPTLFSEAILAFVDTSEARRNV
jgi:3-oxoadipate enol-lactonase